MWPPPPPPSCLSRMVVLDPVLTDIMYKKEEEPPTRGTWQEVMEKYRHICVSMFASALFVHVCV